jgi:hypothetical protein
MSEREQLKYLLEYVTDDRRDAEARLRDSDLWILDAEGRPGLEALSVEQWEHAVAFTEGLVGLSNGVLPLVTSQLLVDVHQRAREGLRRARGRARETS